MGLGAAHTATAFDRAVAFLAGLSLLFVFLLPSQSGASFATYLLALCVLGGGVERWRAFFRAGPLPWVFVALLGYFSSSVWWSEVSSARGAVSIYTRCLLMLAFAVGLSTSLQRVPEATRWMTRSLAVAAAAAAAAALIDFHLHPTWDARLLGLGQLRNSVVAGVAFSGGLIFAFSIVLTGASGWRVAGAVCVALTGAAVYATGSRSAGLSGLIGVWTLLWCRGRWRSPVAWVAIPALGVAAATAALLLQPGWAAALLPRGDSFRLEIWSAELQRLLANGPWFGLGVLMPNDVALQGQVFVHPHNLYLASALQGGVVGLILLLGVLLYAGLTLYRMRQVEDAGLGLALLVTGMSAYLFDGWELIDKVSVSWLLLWVPVAIAIGVTLEMQNRLGIAARSVPNRERA